MKRLILIRHAKSGWDDFSARDFDRDLNDRGRRDAPEMGRRLAGKEPMPDAVLVSTAVRARSTASLMIPETGISSTQVMYLDELYLASASDMMKIVRKVPDDVQTLALLAHNPGITELTNRLAKTYIHNIPTCGMTTLQLPIEQWKSAGSGALLLDFDYPKKEESFPGFSSAGVAGC